MEKFIFLFHVLFLRYLIIYIFNHSWWVLPLELEYMFEYIFWMIFFCHESRPAN